MTTLDEQPWLDRACAGDRDAFGHLIRAHHQTIHRLALRLVRNESAADDVTQETFLNAWRGITKFDRKARLSTWLYRICVNVVQSHRRKRIRSADEIAAALGPAVTAAPDDPMEGEAQARAINSLSDAVEALPEVYRVTLVLAYTEGVSYRDVGLILGCKEGTVAWRIHEARRLLRESLDDTAIEGLDEIAGKGGGRERNA